MAQQKELVFKLKFVDENGAVVEKTAQSINDINKSITDLKNELDNTELGSEAWNGLAEDLGKAEYALEQTTEAINDTKDAQKSLGAQLQGAPGIVGKVSQSVKGLGQTFKALLANPVVAVLAAIVGALTLLFKAFTSTKAGGEKMEQVMAGIGAVLDVLRDRVLKIGGAIVKFFKGDFSGAADDLKGAFSGIGEEIAGEFNAAMKIKAELQAITDATRELNNERARQNTEIAKAKLVINDETKSYEEREKALEEVRQAEIALAKQEEILANRRYEAIKAQNALSDSSKEALDEEAAAYQALQQAQLASLQKQKELFDQQKALRDRRRAEQKAAADKRKQELQSLADLEEQLYLDNIKNQTEAALKELEIQENSQREQLRLLNASAEDGQRILLAIVQDTQRKITAIEKAAQDKRDAIFKSRKQRLLDDTIKADGELIDFQEATILNAEARLSQYMEDVSMGRVEFDRDTQQQLIEQTQKGYDFLVNINKDYSRALLAQEKNRYELQKQERKVENEEAQQANKDAYQAREALLINQYQNEEITEAEFQQAKTDNLNEYLLNIQNIEQDFKRQGELDAELNFNTIRRIVEENAEKEINITKNKNRILKALEKDKQDAQLAGVQIASDAAGALAEIAGQETELGKAFAVIQTTLSTYQAAQQAYASQLTIPTPDAPIRAQIAAGVAIAAGLARVVAIQNTDTSGVKAADGLLVGQGSGRMDNIPVRVSAGESIINARSTSMFKPLLSAINQAGGGRRFASGGITSLSTQTSPETNLLNQISQLQGNTPIKTYVVSTDVSSSVSLDRQIKSRSVL
jgi:hypothetical protein